MTPLSPRATPPGDFRTISTIAAIALLACTGAQSDREPQAGDGVRDVAGSSTGAAMPSWYEQSRALDLTGDGVADTVRLHATGTRPDSLQVTLSLIVGGAVMHEEEWGSSYELALADSAARTGVHADTLLRERLDSVLASVRVQRFDEPGVRVMAEDSAILAGLEPRPTSRISFAYGYETTVRLVWDAPRRRFVRLWSCC